MNNNNNKNKNQNQINKGSKTKKKTTPEGVIAIIIFIIFFIAPNVVVYLQGEFSKMNLIYKILFILIQLIFVILLIYQYYKGSKCSFEEVLDLNNKCYENFEIGQYYEPLRVYNLFKRGGWSNFQRWYAALASNVWQDILFTLVLFFIPFPFLPKNKLDKFELFLVKLGLYKLSLAFVLGSPKYIIQKHTFDNMNKDEKAEMSIVIVLLTIFILLIIYDKFIIKKKV